MFSCQIDSLSINLKAQLVSLINCSLLENFIQPKLSFQGVNIPLASLEADNISFSPVIQALY